MRKPPALCFYTAGATGSIPVLDMNLSPRGRMFLEREHFSGAHWSDSGPVGAPVDPF